MSPLLISAILAGAGIYALKYLVIYQQLEEKNMYEEAVKKEEEDKEEE